MWSPGTAFCRRFADAAAWDVKAIRKEQLEYLHVNEEKDL